MTTTTPCTFTQAVRDRIAAAIAESDAEVEDKAAACGLTAEQLDDPLAFTCPSCGVPAGWRCEAPSGRPVGTHKARCVLARQDQQLAPVVGAR